MAKYNPYYYQIYNDKGEIIGVRTRSKGDFDGCGKISSKDVILFYLIYKNQDDPRYSQYLPVADFNRDGIVDKNDLEIFEKTIKK